MPRIPTVPPEEATGLRKLLYRLVRRRYGGVVPGIIQILATDLKLARSAGSIYEHLHLREDSPLSRVQREMLAVVVNGKIGGAA